MSDQPVLYDGLDARMLAGRLGSPTVVLLETVVSTMDIGHRLAGDGAAAGTVVIADAQTGGRGRAGRQWVSSAGAGIWMTLLERPADAASLDVLSLRIGLAAAQVLDGVSRPTVQLKWPNDLFVNGAKVGGILIEARWRDRVPEWVVIGIGINLRAPDGVPAAAAVDTPLGRVALLERLVPACRAAAEQRGVLGPDELSAFAARDLARGRRCRAPAEGVVRGIAATGEVVIAGAAGEARYRSGSLVLEGEPEGAESVQGERHVKDAARS